jgi:hypothetical protein
LASSSPMPGNERRRAAVPRRRIASPPGRRIRTSCARFGCSTRRAAAGPS